MVLPTRRPWLARAPGSPASVADRSRLAAIGNPICAAGQVLSTLPRAAGVLPACCRHACPRPAAAPWPGGDSSVHVGWPAPLGAARLVARHWLACPRAPASSGVVAGAAHPPLPNPEDFPSSPHGLLTSLLTLKSSSTVCRRMGFFEDRSATSFCSLVASLSSPFALWAGSVGLPL